MSKLNKKRTDSILRHYERAWRLCPKAILGITVLPKESITLLYEKVIQKMNFNEKKDWFVSLATQRNLPEEIVLGLIEYKDNEVITEIINNCYITESIYLKLKELNREYMIAIAMRSRFSKEVESSLLKSKNTVARFFMVKNSNITQELLGRLVKSCEDAALTEIINHNKFNNPELTKELASLVEILVDDETWITNGGEY